MIIDAKNRLRLCRQALSRTMSSCLLIVAFLCSLAQPVFGAITPYWSYTYDSWGDPVPAPVPYEPVHILDGHALGVGAFRSPQDIAAGPDDTLIVLDTGNNRLVVIESDLQTVRIIDSFDHDGEVQRFNGPRGLFVFSDGNIYIADTENGRIVELTLNGELVRVIPGPDPRDDDLFSQGFVYRPLKISVDGAGRIFVIARDQYEGLMEFDVDGQFRGFVGAPRVTPSVFDVLWSRIATDAQRERQALFLPTIYSAIDVDEQGLLYVTKQGAADNEAIKKLNPAGRDVLVWKGFNQFKGDYWPGSTRSSIEGPSAFAGVLARDHGTFSVLDRNRGRVFTYDANGRLLYIFGARGTQRGSFRGPIAITELSDDRIVVLDEIKNEFVIFDPTRYAQLIHAALSFYDTGHYHESEALWKEVLSLNANYELAYAGIGRARFRQHDYVGAMANYRLANDREGYSDSFRIYRRLVIEENFGLFSTLATVIIVFGWVIIRRKRKRRGSEGNPHESAYPSQSYPTDSSFGRNILNGLKYAPHVIIHPFEGFWDLKHERRGNIWSATIILIALILTFVGVRQYTGFIFNYRKIQDLNIIVEALSILVPFFLWIGVNWAFTTLMDGKGHLKDIYIASAYALVPIIVIYVPLTMISNFIVIEEGAMYYLFLTLGVIWSLALLFVATMMTHDYDVKQTVLSSVCIVAGMGFALFVGMLSYEIMSSAISFVTAVINEVRFRL